MKIQFSLFSLAILTLLSFSSCRKNGWPYCAKAKGTIVSETREVGYFHSVDLATSGDVVLTYDSTLSEPIVEVEVNENVIENVKTDVRGEVLHIETDPCVRKLKDLTVYITMNKLSYTQISGSGDIRTTNTFYSEVSRFEINGSGDSDISIVADEVHCDISGSGNIELTGSGDLLMLSVDGSGDISAFKFPVNDCYIEINGSGDCQVNVANLLDVEIDGSGDVLYRGTPTLRINNNGSGSVGRG